MSRPNFDALRDLHNSANDLLHSPKIKPALVHHQHSKKWIHMVSEASLKMLDICGTIKDVLLLVKDHLQQLQSTFRKITIVAERSQVPVPTIRTNYLSKKTAAGDTSFDNKFAAYHIYRKKLKKELLKRLCLLKEMKNQFNIIFGLLPIGHNLMVVVDVLREVRVTTMAIVESLISLMSMPFGPVGKSCKGYFATKFMGMNSVRFWGKCDTTELQTANKRVEAVEIAIEELEVELECIFRRLIRTRVSLLNILTN